MIETAPAREAQSSEARNEVRTSYAARRLGFLDWTRGMAVLIMLQGHVFDAYLRADLRESGPYLIAQFIGGIAPALFLFLTGVTLAFMLDGMERKGFAPQDRVRRALRRAGYLAFLAFAFRFQLWLFAYPYSPWTDLFRVDILNCMAAGIASVAVLGFLNTAQRVHAGVVVGCLISVASPLLSLMNPDTLPWVLQMYVTPDRNFFSYFPWAAFVPFGIAAGSILRLTPSEHFHRVMQWSAIVGFGLIMSGQYFSNLPYSFYPSSDFWVNSPGLIFIKLGVILVIIPLAFLWNHHGSGQGWSWIRQLGTTSLLIYWVHIELVYGRWFGAWKQSLDLLQSTIASIALILAMIMLSRARTHWNWPTLRLGSTRPVQTAGASGD